MQEPDFALMNAQELIEFSESASNLHSWDRKKLYTEAFNRFKAEGDEDLALAMHREALLYEIAANDRDGVRFHPQMSGTRDDGTKVTYPDWEQDFNNDTLEYYKRRVGETTNPVLKARYADLLWERKAGYAYGRVAALAYLDAVPHFYEHNMILEFGDALERALVLATKFGDKVLVKDATDAHQNFIKRIMVDKRFRPMLEVADSLLAQAPKNKGIDLMPLANALEASIKDYAENDQDNYIARHAFLERLSKVRAQQKDALSSTAAKVRQAEAFVEEAESKGGAKGGLVAAHFYEEALRVYMSLGGHDERVTALKVLIQQANDAGKAEFTTISRPVNIPMAANNDRLAKLYQGHSATEIFQIMAVDPKFIPSWDDALAFASKMKDEFVLQFLMSMQVMRSGNIVVKTLTTDAEKIEYRAIDYFQQNYHLSAGSYLQSVFDMLRAEHSSYLDELTVFLATAEVIKAERLAILRHGLRAYEQREYVAAIHIIVFQIEGILRDMLGLAGLPTWTYKRGTDEMRARTLDDILDTLTQIKGFDQNFLKFINLLLNNLMADNIRNDIGHALMPIEAFSQQYAELLLLILIKLVPYGITKKQPAAGESGAESTDIADEAS